MNLLLLYFLLVKATLTSFSGLSSLPVVHTDLVLHYRVLTDRQLNSAVAIGRTTPGPLGIYIVSVGYFVAGVPGACAGWLAMITPAFLIIPMLRWMGARASNERVKSITNAIALASAGLLLSSTVPLARDAVTGLLPLAIALISFATLAFTKLDTLWIIIASAIAGLLTTLFGMIHLS
jgi:chromate transporter